MSEPLSPKSYQNLYLTISDSKELAPESILNISLFGGIGADTVSRASAFKPYSSRKYDLSSFVAKDELDWVKYVVNGTTIDDVRFQISGSIHFSKFSEQVEVVGLVLHEESVKRKVLLIPSQGMDVNEPKMEEISQLMQFKFEVICV